MTEYWIDTSIDLSTPEICHVRIFLYVESSHKYKQSIFCNSTNNYSQGVIYSPTDALVSCLKKNNNKIYIKTAPIFFALIFAY